METSPNQPERAASMLQSAYRNLLLTIVAQRMAKKEARFQPCPIIIIEPKIGDKGQEVSI